MPDGREYASWRFECLVSLFGCGVLAGAMVLRGTYRNVSLAYRLAGVTRW
jgi:hypothetical protein